MFKVRLDTSALKRRLERSRRQHDHDVARVLDLVGQRTVQLLQSYTGETTRTGRRLHPGGWADRTGETRDSYAYEVKQSSGGVQLIITNNSDNAVALEEHDGMYVVRGIADPGGPVQMLFVQVAREMGLKWRFS